MNRTTCTGIVGSPGVRRKLRPVMPRIRYILAVLSVGGIVLLLTGCPGTMRKRSGIPARPITSAKVPEKSTKLLWHGGAGYRISFPDPAAPAWVADVKTGEADEKTGLSILHGVKCHMYRQGHEVMYATADEGKALMQGKIAHITLLGHVLATEPQQGMQLTAEKFRWTTNEDHVVGTKVHWRGMGFDHCADQGVFALDLSEGSCEGHITTKTGQP